jgi:serine/threonine protein kinase/formylglycine-generating enzyme required for sulfatase activity/predicted esterase
VANKCPKCNADNPDTKSFCGDCGTQLGISPDVAPSVTKTLKTPTKGVRIGATFAERYRIVDELGRGGMGIVYKAEDLRLKRMVALKFLPPALTQDEEAKERFVLEARAAAAISHPNICTIHEIDEYDDQTYIAMEFVEGQSLRDLTKKGTIPVADTLDLAIQVASGLEEAHNKGVIHRDIKSANIMVTPTGQAKIMDFGLAKVSVGAMITQEGVTMGTVAYMSPEQTRGEVVDHRTDIWSLGVVLYEMLSGRLPFMAEHETSVMYAIVHEEPVPVQKFNPAVPVEMVRIINRCLQKKPDSRYQSAADMLEALKEYHDILKAPELGIKDFKSFLRVVRKPKVAIPAVFIILALCAAAFWYFDRQSKVRWATDQALPQIMRFIEEENNFAAFQLARQAEKYIPKSSMLKEHWAKISRTISLDTTPPGADVYIKNNKDPESEWEHLGQTPIEQVRLPLVLLRWKFEKQGFVTKEGVFGPWSHEEKLFETQNAPPGMIWLPAQKIQTLQAYYIGVFERLEIGDCWIDRFEVTNKQFKAFLDSGGYEKQDYWKVPFTKEGRALSWKEAIKDFVDKTGQLGPATWELRDYPEGKDDHPVTGVSWYEAAAYAEYAGKSLPTIFHWTTAANLMDVTDIVPFCNFSGKGTAPVGSYQGMSPWGAYDMGGNVKEWCWNETRGLRYIMGGGWDDAPYMFFAPYAKSPFDRAPSNGFRCALEVSKDDKFARLWEPIPPLLRDYSKEKPVNDEIFRVYKDFYDYEKTELASKVESIDESAEHWIKEKITFNAAYENERMMAYLYLPKKGKPPFQTVIWFPDASKFYLRSSDRIDEDLKKYIDFLLIQGRAVLYPIYKSTYERQDGFNVTPPDLNRNSWRDHCIKWSQDLGRAIDYLETREDIDKNKLAYHGLSQGAIVAPILLALESRIKTGILEAGGLIFGSLAEIVSPDADPFHFAPRVKIPILMLNGEYDIIRRVEESQEQLYRFLGSPEEHKYHKVYETSHHAPRLERIKEVTAFLDRYLGKVR